MGDHVTQNAKAENEHFAAMREKEMSESERKAMAQQPEKQGHLKAIERAAKVEKHLYSQTVHLFVPCSVAAAVMVVCKG